MSLANKPPGEGNGVDVNRPVENPKLKELLSQWRQEQTDDLLSQAFEEIVIRAHFLSIITLSEEPAPSGDNIATFLRDTVMEFPMLTTREGKHFYPAFTDWGELAKWQSVGSTTKALILSFDDYASMVEHGADVDGVAINPFGDSFLLDRPLLAHLKTQKDLNTRGVSQQVVAKETKVLLGEPKEYPTAMVAAISDYLRKQPTVRRAWLRLMFRDNEQSYLLVAEFSGQKDALFGAIAEAARPHLNGMYIDMVPYEEGFGQDAVERAKPFYEKK